MCSGRIFTEAPGGACGQPDCPVLSPGESAFSSLYAPDSDEKGVSYYRFGLVPRLEAGIGYAWGNSRMLGSVNYLLRPEDADHPALMLGVGSRRTGGSDSSAFLSAVKSVPCRGKSIRLNLGLAYTLRQSVEGHQSMDSMDMLEESMSMDGGHSHGGRKAFVMAGAAFSLGKSVVGAFQYDGGSLHAILTGRVGSTNVGVMFLELRDPALLISYSLAGER